MVEFDDAKCLDTPYVLGDFAALGTASSFHSESVRRVQEYAMVESPSHLQLVGCRGPEAKAGAGHRPHVLPSAGAAAECRELNMTPRTWSHWSQRCPNLKFSYFTMSRAPKALRACRRSSCGMAGGRAGATHCAGLRRPGGMAGFRHRSTVIERQLDTATAVPSDLPVCRTSRSQPCRVTYSTCRHHHYEIDPA